MTGTVDLACRYCAALFQGARIAGRPPAYCSAACRRRAAYGSRAARRRDRPSQPALQIACDICGIAFEAQRKKGRRPHFCSKRCALAATVRRTRSYRADGRSSWSSVCPVCQADFRSIRARTCSTVCARELQRRAAHRSRRAKRAIGDLFGDVE